MVKHMEGAMSVESEDILSAAVSDAMNRYKAVEAGLGPTLVDTISVQDWKSWNALEEKATFADSVGVDDLDPADFDEVQPQAA